MTSVVLDASALLALLLGEPGLEKVRAVLADCSTTTVNIDEVVGHTPAPVPAKQTFVWYSIPCRSSASPSIRASLLPPACYCR
jgi:PIN domain nuclease of toxin-antitoxin system